MRNLYEGNSDTPMNEQLIRRASKFGLGRRLIRRFYNQLSLPLDLELELNFSERSAYLYCCYHAANLAKRLGIPRISVLEFGCAGGRGLLFLEQVAPKIKSALGVDIEIYGFDTGAGLPTVVRPEDLPYWFQPSQYKMDVAELQSHLRTTKLVLGNVSDTVGKFCTKYRPAPIGAVLNDLDLYTSTRDSLKLFESDPSNFLPRVFMYFDDIIGHEFEMYSECNGQLLAISEFNQRQRNSHIGLNQNLLGNPAVFYRYQIYYAHLKNHPMYCNYVGNAEQQQMETALQLKAS